ncbi:MAG TPA: GGDEF domain-containing protein [Solimonas sp.]
MPASFAASAQLRTRILRVVGWTLGGLTCFATLVRAWVAPLHPQILILAITLSLVLLALPAFGSVRHWTPRLGRAVTLVSMVLVLSTGYLAGGLDAPVVILLTVSPLLGVVLVGRRFGVLVAMLVVVALLGLVWLHRLGAVPPTELSGDALRVMRAFMLMMGLTVIAAAVYIYDQHSHDLVQRFQRDALTDPLTGLYNRRYLEFAFSRLEQQAADQRAELWLALIDVDRFKRINDSRGHEAGDQCLQQVAMALRRVAQAMPDSIVARVAGDEFVVVAVGHRARLRSWMDQATLSLVGNGDDALSISVGLAGLAAGASQPEALRYLLARADAALYRAKKSGRGRVVVLDPKSPMPDSPSSRGNRPSSPRSLPPRVLSEPVF